MPSRNHILKAVGLTALAAAVAAPMAVHAQHYDTWVHIGSQRADFERDRDVFSLDKIGGRLGRFKFEVRGRRVSIYSLKLVYEDGGARVIGLSRNRYRPGRTAGVFRNPLPERKVAYIEIGHRTLHGRRHFGNHLASVALYAKQHHSEPVPPHDGGASVVLGSMTPRRHIAEHTVRVGFGRGPFRALRFKAHNRTAVITGFEVTFGNGRKQFFRSERVVFRGAQTPELDLAGRQRFIDRITVRYRRSRIDLFRTGHNRFHRPRARLEVIGIR